MLEINNENDLDMVKQLYCNNVATLAWDLITSDQIRVFDIP